MAEHKLSNYLADDDSTTGPGTEEAAASCVEDQPIFAVTAEQQQKLQFTHLI